MKLTRVMLIAFIALFFVSSLPAAQPNESDSLRAITEQLGEELEILAAECVSLYERYEEAEGEAKILTWTILSRRGAEAEEKLEKYVDNLSALQKEGQPEADLQQKADEALKIGFAIMETDVARRRASMARMMEQLPELEIQEQFKMEQLIASENVELDLHLGSYLAFCEFKQTLQLDPGEELKKFDALLLERATNLLGFLEAATEKRQQLDSLKERTASDQAKGIDSEKNAVEERLHWVINSLEAAVTLMDKRGFETALYKQSLILARGGFTTDIFERGVALGLLQRSWNQLKDWFAKNGFVLVLRLLLFSVIVILSILVARFAGRFVTRTYTKAGRKFPVLLKEMVASIASKGIFLLGLLIALSTLGIELGPLLAGLGIAGFIVGFALQDSLSNFAAGLMILVYRPFDLGDSVEAAGVMGKVSRMSLVTTSILTFDNQTLIVPNAKVWGNVIRNLTAEPTRRVDMVFRIGHREDVTKAERILKEIVQSQEQILDDPKPFIEIKELGEWSIDFVVRPWAKTEDYWNVYYEVTRRVKERFDEEGIPLPYPQRSVHFQQELPLLDGRGGS
jgi:small conductance mechanosensitive channel